MPAALTDRRTRPAGLPRALPLVVVALVIGILGMHALGSGHTMAMHGADHGTDHRTAATMKSQVSHEVAEGADLIGTVPAVSSTTVGAAVVNASGAADHGTGTMMMLCGAMLVSAGALLLTRFVRQRHPRIWALLSTVADVRAGPPTARTSRTRQPPVWELSVLRC